MDYQQIWYPPESKEKETNGGLDPEGSGFKMTGTALVAPDRTMIVASGVGPAPSEKKVKYRRTHVLSRLVARVEALEVQEVLRMVLVGPVWQKHARNLKVVNN